MIRILLTAFLCLSLGGCMTVRSRGNSTRDYGGDRAWLKRTEPRIPRSGVAPQNREFEQIRLDRWKRAADSIGMKWPLKKVQITSKFGYRNGEAHDGVDLRAPVGTPVYAAHEGRVLYAGNGIQGYGSLVVIRHPTGIATVYAHNSKLRVQKGQRVGRGQLIAFSGATGRASGPHVHFEVRAGSRPMDPLDLVGRASSAHSSVALLD